MSPIDTPREVWGEWLAQDRQTGLIPEAVADQIAEALARPNPLRSLFPPPKPLTRRQRLRYKWWRVRSYFHHLGLALLNRCDREGYDW